MSHGWLFPNYSVHLPICVGGIAAIHPQSETIWATYDHKGTSPVDWDEIQDPNAFLPCGKTQVGNCLLVEGPGPLPAKLRPMQLERLTGKYSGIIDFILEHELAFQRASQSIAGSSSGTIPTIRGERHA